CPHCGTPVEGPNDTWCCAGCELAAEIIAGAGLERYYAEREAFAPRPEPRSEGWSAVPVERRDDGSCAVSLMVDGLRCASCVWVTENLLQRTPGVVDAQVSYASGRARLRWDPAQVDLSTLAGTIAALGYRPRLLGEEARPDRDLLLRLGVATFGAMNVMLFSAALYAGWWGDMAPRFVALFHWVSLAVATPVAFWSAAPFFAGALAGLRHRVLHMDLPIAIAVAVLWVHGAVTVAMGPSAGLGEPYLDSLTMLVALLLAGRLLEGRGRRRAAEAAVSLAAVVPATARRLRADGSVVTVPSQDLVVGERIVVGAGEELPADGVVSSGTGFVRLALLTGEAEPVPVEPGARVFAGTVLEDGALECRVTAIAEATVVRRMADDLRRAADRAVEPTAADRLAPWFTAVTLLVAAATFFAWFTLADASRALSATVAVLVVACPCALALAHPLAAAAGLGSAARRGLLFRSSEALLELSEADRVVLDKTGTVTAGEMVVVAADDPALRIAAGLERFSVHPVARAITREASERGIALPEASEVRETAGVGIEGVVDGRRWRLERGGPGRVDLVDETGDRRSLYLGDRLRIDSAPAVADLRALGLSVTLLTGDDAEPARRMAREAGIDDVRARFSPQEKTAWIEAARARDEHVVFVGDGLNDGPALAAADVGIAMGSGAASSILAADGVLASPSLAPVAAAVRAARAARRAIRANLARSLAYNVTAVGAAAAGLVNPLVAAVLMPLSSGM
ncbi:MAG: cadmium-translocating P-type ATPase, partial [Gemmatimonadetes bacterium]|nr:cadmium-translocating P-type ATPase [Gemmatimonadota bacterium]